MKDPLESVDFAQNISPEPRPADWLKVGMVAAASALAGGMAAAWFYRKTITRLRQAEISDTNTEFGISDDDLNEDF